MSSKVTLPAKITVFTEKTICKEMEKLEESGLFDMLSNRQKLYSKRKLLTRRTIIFKNYKKNYKRRKLWNLQKSYVSTYSTQIHR